MKGRDICWSETTDSYMYVHDSVASYGQHLHSKLLAVSKNVLPKNV